MRVAFVAPYFHPFTGGVETASWEMTKALVGGHAVEVEVHTSRYVAPDEVMPPGVTEYCGGGLTVYRYRASKRVICFRPKVSRECEVLHVLGFHRLLVPAAVLSASHCLAVLQTHGNVSMVCGEPPSLARSLRLLADKTVSRWMVSKFSIVLCLNEAERQAMVRAGVPAERTRLLRAPLRLNSSAECTSEGCSTRDGNLFLCVCRVTRLKYIEHAITALPRAPRARLVVIGPLVDEGYHRELVLRARDLGVEERVRFVGALSAADLGPWYARSTGVVLCSRSEGQPLVPSEAAWYGSVPILARGGSDELVSAMRCGLMYRWGDTEELAQRLEELMDARASFEPDLASARAFVETELSPSVVAAKLMGIYGELGVGT